MLLRLRAFRHIVRGTSINRSQVRKLHIDPWDADTPISQATTPPASWYTDDALAAHELLRVRESTWQLAARDEQLRRPGDYVAGRVMNLPYVVCRDDSNELRAFHNVCRHRAAAVASGSGSASSFICPYHGWQYGLDGKLQLAKRLKGIRSFKATDNGLVPMQVGIWGPFVFISSRPPHSSLQAWLGEGGKAMLPRIDCTPGRAFKHIHSRSYPIECNWKVFCDNYLDGGYHVPVAHVDLAAGLDMSSYKSTCHETVSIQTVRPATLGGSETAPPRLTDERGLPAAYAYMFPNFMMNVYGSWLDTHHVIPRGAGRCTVECSWYLREDALGDQLHMEESLAASHQIQLEDVALCEAVQGGLTSPAYNTGRYAPAVETPMHHFHQLLARLLKTG